MIIARTIKEARQAVQRLRNARSGNARSASVGFVPTMGYLHEGHGSLIERAKQDNEIVVLSIFVNPLQFGPNEDYNSYPRDEDKDFKYAAALGVDLIFTPPVSEMYPEPVKTTVTVSELTARLCGASRPGHFDGVTTVVSKLFHIISPDKAYFGQKDAQQAAVITQMVQDLSMNIQIVTCPTLREPDGLALSSRNVYLSAEERKQALVLYESLNLAKQEIVTNKRITVGELVRQMESTIRSAPDARIDYIEVLTYPKLQPLANNQSIDAIEETEYFIIALAVFIGKTRLIDNCILESGKAPIK